MANSTYNGEDFIATSDQAVGDQISGSNQEVPLDVFIERRLTSNQEYMATGLDSCTGNFFVNLSASSNGFDITSNAFKPYSTYNEGSVLYIPFYQQQDLQSINLSGEYAVRNTVRPIGTGSEGPDFNVSASLSLQSAQNVERTTFTLENTYDFGGGSHDRSDFSASLELEKVGSPIWSTLRVGISCTGSQTSTVYGTENARSTEDGYMTFPTAAEIAAGSTTSTPYSYPSNTSASYDALENKWLRYQDEDGNFYQGGYDLLSLDIQTGRSYQEMYTHPTIQFAERKAEIVDMNHVCFKHMTIESVYDSASLNTAEKIEQRAKIPVSTVEATKLPLAIKSLNQRARLLAFGPLGQPVSGSIPEEQPDNYGEGVWNIASNIPVIGGGLPIQYIDDVIIDESVQLSKIGSTANTGDGFLTVAMYLICYQPFLSNVRGRIDLKIDVNVEQLSDGDASWGDATTVASSSVESPRIFHYAGDRECPLLRSQFYKYNKSVFAYKDGIIYDEDIPFLGLPVIANVDLDGVNIENPVRVKAIVDWENSPAFLTSNEINVIFGELIEVACVGYSIWERGK